MLTELVHEDQLAAVYKKAYPHQNLRPFIEFYRETIHGQDKLPIRYLPNVAFTIRFNLGKQFSLKNEKHSFISTDHILVPNNHTWVDDGHFFAIKFRFGLLPFLLGASHKSIQDSPVPINNLLSAEYIQAIESAASFEERVELSEHYFSGLYEQNINKVEKYKVVEEVVNRYYQSNFNNFREEGMKNNFVSSKSLQRYFLKNFGITPKTVYCILRTRKALESYFSNDNSFRVHDFDYYDYSHFYKEIKKVVGLNLAQLKNGEPVSKYEI
jgi:hypothetical protein